MNVDSCTKAKTKAKVPAKKREKVGMHYIWCHAEGISEPIGDSSFVTPQIDKYSSSAM